MHPNKQLFTHVGILLEGQLIDELKQLVLEVLDIASLLSRRGMLVQRDGHSLAADYARAIMHDKRAFESMRDGTDLAWGPVVAIRLLIFMLFVLSIGGSVLIIAVRVDDAKGQAEEDVRDLGRVPTRVERELSLRRHVVRSGTGAGCRCYSLWYERERGMPDSQPDHAVHGPTVFDQPSMFNGRG